MGIQKLDIHSNSYLVINKLQGTYQAWDSKMMAYLAHVKELQSSFKEFNITQVYRLKNGHADVLAKLG